MADLTNIFDGGFKGVEREVVDPPEIQLRNAIANAGLEAPEVVTIDGRIHRFRSGSKGRGGFGDKTGWYIAFADGVPAGRFGCWRAGLEQTWSANTGKQITQVEQMAMARRMQEAKAHRDAELKRLQSSVSESVEAIWSECMAAQNSHPYLATKGIQPNGARITGDGRLVLPLFDADGTLSTLQYIDSNGGKLYHSGGKTGGMHWMIGTMDEQGVLYIAEGFATAATIYEATGRPCVAAYSASNLVPVTEAMRGKYGTQQSIVIVADNDASGVGMRYAEQAAAKYGARVVMPPVSGDANDYAQSGNDLLALLQPRVDEWLVPADDFSSQPAPIKWLVKRWIPHVGLMMVHGPSGGGKTFVVLDWCLSIAGGLTERMGHRVRNGTVVYLAGEGHHGLRGRIAAWKQDNHVDRLDMYLSKDGCDLNTPDGYQRVAEAIRAIPTPPAIIVVDTLHRFLSGDENSAQDTKTMLDACGGLTNEFNCVVLLVHHTGVNEAAQHRARGSSAWKGALDIEISIVPADGDAPMEIVQRKSKDAEIAPDMYARLESVQINGWYDEDGEPVTSAVVRQAEASEKKPKSKAPSKLDKHKKIMERAFWNSGAEERDGMPYVSRSALADLLRNDGMKDSAIRNYCKASYDGGVINTLISSDTISPFEHGWVVTDMVMASALLLGKTV